VCVCVCVRERGRERKSTMLLPTQTEEPELSVVRYLQKVKELALYTVFVPVKHLLWFSILFILAVIVQ